MVGYSDPLREAEVCEHAGSQRSAPSALPEGTRGVHSALRRGDLPPRTRERLEMVKAADLGRDLGEVVAWSGRTPRPVRRWLGMFAREGIEALTDAPRSGRPARADDAYLNALEEAADASPREELGLGFDVWTSERLSVYLRKRTGVGIASSWLRALLARRRFRCGRPKHTLSHLRDPERLPPARPSWRRPKKSSARARALRAALPGRDAP